MTKRIQLDGGREYYDGRVRSHGVAGNGGPFPAMTPEPGEFHLTKGLTFQKLPDGFVAIRQWTEGRNEFDVRNGQWCWHLIDIVEPGMLDTLARL
jgi:hypothetical protein